MYKPFHFLCAILIIKQLFHIASFSVHLTTPIKSSNPLEGTNGLHGEGIVGEVDV